MALASLGDLEGAVADYTGAISANPDLVEAHANLGIVYYQLGRTEEAIDELKTARRLTPGVSLIHYNLAVAYEKLGKVTDALACARRAHDLDPANDAYRDLLARLEPRGSP